MKILFLMFHDSVLRFLVPKLISSGEEVYAANKGNYNALLNSMDFNYIVVDYDNCGFDVISLMKKISKENNAEWIYYTYQYDELFIDVLKNEKVKGVLSKNIHPEYLVYKLKNILYNEKQDFIQLRRKFYRANIEPKDNVKVTLYLPTIKTPIFGKARELSILGMHIILENPADIILFREGLYLSRIYLSLNGFRLNLSGKIIRQSNEGGMVFLFDKMDNFTHDHVAKYIYKSIDNYLLKIRSKSKV